MVHPDTHHRQAGELPEYLPAITPGLSLPFGLSSFALSLLLAYRVKESYGRFDEVRKFWGGVVNRTRDLCRQVPSCYRCLFLSS